ncbi:FAD-linked oxidoreductase chyH [Colletotrichum viniferum]|nr:FAD-linked oxidoreductase chyH [Colletotrichum viniferum]
MKSGILLDLDELTVTGACECVSYLRPGLGGGYGFLQGRHGLIGDQFRSMNVVLANGTLVTINETATPDLWWAMNGAGHNFGIVTSATSQIYDVEHQDWALELMNFSGDLVEEVYKPVDLINWSYWMMSPDLDAEKPIVQILLMQEGVTTVDPAYTAPFHALGPLSNSSESGVYTDLAKFVGVRTTDGPCLKTGTNNPRFSIYFETYNTTAQKLAFDFFANSIVANSALSNSLVTFDDYSMQGVKAKAGRDFVPVYLNYAFGNEGPEQWYGQEEWRVTRLREAKAAYDPHDLFSFYGPIA